MKIFKFQVNEPFAKRNNELLRDSARLRTSGITMGMLLICAGIATFLLVNAPWAATLGIGLGLFGIAGAVIGIIAAHKVGTAHDLYARYPLAPAIIVEVNERDMVLMALVNTNVDPNVPPRWGVTLRTVTKIPGISNRRVGTRVPVAAVSGQTKNRQSSHWQMITPMPIAWGTPDQEVVAAAKDAIPQEQWELLQRARQRLTDVRATKYDLLVL
ncbi:MAG: DUF3239 domain-containing protein [Corynebacterium sp.]|nr:DUF3239 domain-containing protein [Corynebacterium sp.]